MRNFYEILEVEKNVTKEELKRSYKKLAKKYHKPVIAFAGGIEKGAEACNKAGITAFFPAVRGVTTLDEAMRPETAAENLAESAEQVFRLLTLR